MGSSADGPVQGLEISVRVGVDERSGHQALLLQVEGVPSSHSMPQLVLAMLCAIQGTLGARTVSAAISQPQ